MKKNEEQQVEYHHVLLEDPASNSESNHDHQVEYHHVLLEDPESDNESNNDHPDLISAGKTMKNFTIFSICFSANHASVVSCLSLATSRLGSTGAWQNGILYICYCLSAVLGSTYAVKRAGARNTLLFGMGLYCFYVLFFFLATISVSYQRLAAWTGAGIGGIGAGFLWTAQGSYFGKASEQHARHLCQPITTSTASLAGVFAFLYLAEEVLIRLLSTFLLETRRASWTTIFLLYSLVALLSTLPIPFLYDYSEKNQMRDSRRESVSEIFSKATVAGRMLKNDRKMRYLVPLNASFGLSASFLGSYVNEVVQVALKDDNYILLLFSWVAIVAAGMSLVFGKIAPIVGKGPILITGACCFFLVAFPFVLQPDANKYGWNALLFVYTMQGIGRATWESTFKAMFMDYFSYEKEGASANIILQNGLSAAIGYILSFSLVCKTPSKYCVEYSNGSLHNVLIFELIILASAICAVLGYLRASSIHKEEQRIENNT